MLKRSPVAQFGSRRPAAIAAMLGVVLLAAAAPAHAAVRDPLSNSGALAWWSAPPEVASSAIDVPLRVDGTTFEVRAFRSSLSPSVVVERWRSWWRTQSIAALESRAGSWRVLAFRRDTDLVTVQLRSSAAGGTEGYVSRATADARSGTHRRPAPPLRLPPGAHVLRTVESSDGARTATQTVIATEATAVRALAWFAHRARLAGWSPALPADHAPDAKGAPRLHESGRWFVRGDDELGIFVQAHSSGAVALVHHARDRARAREEW